MHNSLEALLVSARLVLVLGPVSRAVGGEALVGKDDLARLPVKREFELRLASQDISVFRFFGGHGANGECLHLRG